MPFQWSLMYLTVVYGTLCSTESVLDCTISQAPNKKKFHTFERWISNLWFNHLWIRYHNYQFICCCKCCWRWSTNSLQSAVDGIISATAVSRYMLFHKIETASRPRKSLHSIKNSWDLQPCPWTACLQILWTTDCWSGLNTTSLWNIFNFSCPRTAWTSRGALFLRKNTNAIAYIILRLFLFVNIIFSHFNTKLIPWVVIIC